MAKEETEDLWLFGYGYRETVICANRQWQSLSLVSQIVDLETTASLWYSAETVNAQGKVSLKIRIRPLRTRLHRKLRSPLLAGTYPAHVPPRLHPIHSVTAWLKWRTTSG